VIIMSEQKIEFKVDKLLKMVGVFIVTVSALFLTKNLFPESSDTILEYLKYLIIAVVLAVIGNYMSFNTFKKHISKLSKPEPEE